MIAFFSFIEGSGYTDEIDILNPEEFTRLVEEIKKHEEETQIGLPEI